MYRYELELRSAQTAEAARFADTEGAAVANDVGATVRDAGKFASAQSRRRESRFSDAERAASRGRVDIRRGVKSRAPSEHPRNDRRGRGGRGAVGAGRARAGRTSQRGQQFNHDGVRTDTSQRVADQIVVRRHVLEPVRRHQTRTAGDQLFVGRKRVYVNADVSGSGAESRTKKRRAIRAGVGEVDYGITLGQVGRIANLER